MEALYNGVRSFGRITLLDGSKCYVAGGGLKSIAINAKDIVDGLNLLREKRMKLNNGHDIYRDTDGTLKYCHKCNEYKNVLDLPCSGSKL